MRLSRIALPLCLLLLAGCADMAETTAPSLAPAPAPAKMGADAPMEHTPPPATAPLPSAGGVATHHGMFRVHMELPPGGPRLGRNELTLMLRDQRGQMVSGAKVLLEAWMPRQARGTAPPNLEEANLGVYRTRDLELDQPGQWRLTVKIKLAELEDWAVFNLPLLGQQRPAARAQANEPADKAPAPAQANGPADKAPAPARTKAQAPAAPAAGKVDLSREVMGRHKLFKVACNGPTGGVLLNLPQDWRLRITTRDGKPLTRAQVTVNASLASGKAKGQAVTARSLGNGHFLVPRLAFARAGRWLLSVEVMALGRADQADFRLTLE